MKKIISLVNTILVLCNNKDIVVRQMKLQKLLYFSVGIYSCTNDDWPMEYDFQAWPFGPVVPIIYNSFKSNGSRPINSLLEPWDSKIASSVLDAVEETISEYGWYGDFTLSKITHIADAPWQETIKNKGMNEVIERDIIREYFRKDEQRFRT